MPQGIFITVTHTGSTSSAIFLADIYPTTDGHTAFNRAGPVYVPVSGSITLAYSDTVALSFESGNIRKFVDAGYLTATLSLAGTGLQFPPATGDASGTYPNLTVTGIQGFPIQNGVGPANGDALLYNSLTNQWEHAPIVFGGGPPVGPAGGDLGGLYPNPGVTGLQTDPLPVAVAGGFLKRDAANTGWEEVTYGSGANTVCVGNDARLSDSRVPTGAAGGDLAGTYPNPTIALLAVTDAKVAVANKDGLAAVASMRTLGTGATQACAGNDARLSDSRAPTGTAGGDLNGSYPNPTVDALQGNAVSAAAPAVGNALVWNGAAWTPTSGSGAAFSPRLGNVAVVDAVNGNDATGVVNGTAFLTVPAALTAIGALGAPGTVWVLPGTYTLAAGITIPTTCSIRGMSTQTTTIRWAASVPGGTATLLTMGVQTRVEDVTLLLTSTDATTNLVGIALPGATSQTSKIRTCVLTVNNATVPTGSTTSVVGVLSNGASPIVNSAWTTNFSRGVTISVYSNGGGSKRAILCSTPSVITLRDTNFYCAPPADVASVGSYFAVETTDNLALATFRTCTLGGGVNGAGAYTGGDILQTAPATGGGTTAYGIYLGDGTDLINHRAGGLPFSITASATLLIYSLKGNVQNAARYYWPGNQTAGDATETFIRIQERQLVYGLFVTLRQAPGLGQSVTVTLRKSLTGVSGSGVATAFVVTISGVSTTGQFYGASDAFDKGEYLSVQSIATGGTPADLLVQVDTY